jgi:hypothetical protein
LKFFPSSPLWRSPRASFPRRLRSHRPHPATYVPQKTSSTSPCLARPTPATPSCVNTASLSGPALTAP